MCSPQGECCCAHRMVRLYPPGLTCDNCITLRGIKLVHRCSAVVPALGLCHLEWDDLTGAELVERFLCRRTVGRSIRRIQDEIISED